MEVIDCAFKRQISTYGITLHLGLFALASLRMTGTMFVFHSVTLRS